MFGPVIANAVLRLRKLGYLPASSMTYDTEVALPEEVKIGLAQSDDDVPLPDEVTSFEMIGNQMPAIQVVRNDRHSWGIESAKNVVVEIGSQTVRYSKEISEAHGLKPYNTPQKFYSQFGLDTYSSLDIDGNNNAVVADLNEYPSAGVDSVRNGEGFIRLVTNNGTSEHIFNQSNLFRHIHDLTQRDVGAIILHCLPVSYFDHGFYNYNPNLFFSVAKANHYEYLFGYIAGSAGLPISPMFPKDWLSLPTKIRRNFASSLGDNRMLVFACRTTEANQPFAEPIQHVLYGDVAVTAEIQERYK